MLRVELLRGSLLLPRLPLECDLHSLSFLVQVDVRNVTPIEGKVFLPHGI